MKKLKLFCVTLISISVIFIFVCPVYGATPTTINDVFTVYKNDDYTILNFDVNNTYYREYIVYDDGVQTDTTDIWSYGKSKTFSFQDYMDVSALYVYPMSGQNKVVFNLPISQYNQQFYYDINLEFAISDYQEIVSSNMRLYVSYYNGSTLLNQESILYSLDENGLSFSEESMLLCPNGTTEIRLHFRLYFDGDAISDTRLSSVFTMNKFQLQFTNNVSNEIFDGLFNDPESDQEANDFNTGMNSIIEQNQANKNQASDFNRPDPGNLKTQFNPYQYIGSNSVALFTDTIAMITQAPIIVTMLSVCIGVCAISYVFFGKKR